MAPRPKRKAPLEHDDQVEIAEWLDSAGVLWTHPPNGVRIPIGQAMKLKRAGLKKGVPDLLIFTPPPLHPEARGVAIELKRETGGRVDADQIRWLGALRDIGWVTGVCKGVNETLAMLESLGFAPRA